MVNIKKRYSVLMLAVLTFLLVILAGTLECDASTYYYFKSPKDGKTVTALKKVNVKFYAGVVNKYTKMDAWGNPESTTYQDMPVTFKVFKGSQEIYSKELTYTKATTLSVPYTPMASGTLRLCIYGRNLGLNVTEQTLQDTIRIKVRKPKASALSKVRPVISVDRAARKKAVITCEGTMGYSMKIYRATKKGGKYKLIKTTTKSKFTDTGISAGKVYYYKVRLSGKSGKKTYLSKYSAAVKADKYIASSDKSDLKIVLTNTKSGVKITWKRIKKAGYYLVWREGIDTVCLGETELEWIDKDAKKGKTYTYYVSAWYGNDEYPLVKSHVKITVK